MQQYLDDRHLELKRLVREFGRDHIAPVAGEMDRKGEFPWENVRRMADMGLFGISVPEELGGQGHDGMSTIVVIEELARWDASHSITISAHTGLGMGPILQFGSQEQKERFIPYLASGKVIGGFGLTEAGAGSDASGSRTRAVREGDGYRLNGAKVFITHAGIGEIFTVTAVTDPSAGSRGITSFVVTKPTTDVESAEAVGVGHAPQIGYIEGVKAGKEEDKMGWRSSDTRELLLENAFVPAENRLGEEGEGFINFMKTLDAGRIGIAALSLGLAQGAFDTAFRFAREHGIEGSRLWNSQVAQFQLADAATELEAGRHLTYYAAWLKDTGQPFSREAAMAKLFCSELAMSLTLRCIHLMGASGYTDEYPVERMARDAKIGEIGEGTNEIQRLVIARSLLTEAMSDVEVRDPIHAAGAGRKSRETVHAD